MHHPGILLLASLTFAGPAFANSACDAPRDDFDSLYCLNKVYQEADRELNENYKKLAANLDSNGKTLLKRTQLDWIEQRNAACSRREGDTFWVNLRCAKETTVKRAQFLQDRYRECVSAGCQNSKLE